MSKPSATAVTVGVTIVPSTHNWIEGCEMTVSPFFRADRIVGIGATPVTFTPGVRVKM